MMFLGWWKRTKPSTQRASKCWIRCDENGKTSPRALSKAMWLSRACMSEKEPTTRTRQGYHIESNRIESYRMLVCLYAHWHQLYYTIEKHMLHFNCIPHANRTLNDMKEMEISTKEGTILLLKLRMPNSMCQVRESTEYRFQLTGERWIVYSSFK